MNFCGDILDTEGDEWAVTADDGAVLPGRQHNHLTTSDKRETENDRQRIHG